MDVIDRDVEAIPAANLHVAREEFVALWSEAERLVVDRRGGWYTVGVAQTCRWLADATVRPASGAWYRQPAPVTERSGSAYPERIEAEVLAAHRLLARRPSPAWLLNRPGWLEGVVATLEWAWGRNGPPVALPMGNPSGG